MIGVCRIFSGFAGCRFRVDDRFTGNDQYGESVWVITGDRTDLPLVSMGRYVAFCLPVQLSV